MPVEVTITPDPVEYPVAKIKADGTILAFTDPTTATILSESAPGIFKQITGLDINDYQDYHGDINYSF